MGMFVLLQSRHTHTAFQAQSKQQHCVKSRLITTHSSRRDALFSGLVVSGSLLLPGTAQSAAPAPPKPFCGVVDQVPGWAFSTPWQEDIIDFAGGKTWYRYVNYVPPAGSGLLAPLQRRYSPAAPDKLPLLLLSGGPGLPCTYLESVELMAGVGRRVIFYDPVGCGNTFLASNSSCPPAEQLTLDLYMQQIDALRSHLKLDKLHLYGQGVGGMLALSYAAAKQGPQGGIVSVTAASTANSYSQLIQDRLQALQQLKLEATAEEQLLAADAAGSLLTGSSNATAAAAMQQYSQQYICQLQPATAATPPGCARSAAQRRSKPVFDALAGSKYFAAAGALADWDSKSLAGGLQELPVLVARGEFDEVSQQSAQQLADGLAKGQFASFAGAGSYQHIDCWEPHLTKVEEHLCLSEGSPLPTAT